MFANSGIKAIPLFPDSSSYGKVYRSEMPSSKKLNQFHSEYDITTIVQLCSDDEFDVYDQTMVPNLQKEKKFEVIKFSIEDRDVPVSYAKTRDLVDRIIGIVEKGENVAIHCVSGNGRTGLLMACLARKILGYNGSEAIEWVRKFIPKAVETHLQRRFVSTFLEMNVLKYYNIITDAAKKIDTHGSQKNENSEQHSYVIFNKKTGEFDKGSRNQRISFAEITEHVQIALKSNELTIQQKIEMVNGYKAIRKGFKKATKDVNWFVKLFISENIAQREKIAADGKIFIREALQELKKDKSVNCPLQNWVNMFNRDVKNVPNRDVKNVPNRDVKNVPNRDVKNVPFYADTLHGKIYRSPMPSPEKLDQYASQFKITTIVQLCFDCEFEKYGQSKVPALREEKQFKVIKFPIKDLDIPESKAETAELVESIIKITEDKENVAIHCFSGNGRTGLILACLARKILGLDGPNAIQWVRKFIPGAVETLKQKQFIATFLEDDIKTTL